MQWPEVARDPDLAPPALSIDPTGHLAPTDGVSSGTDDPFEVVCAELGSLLARRVEPVSARVLPFGREQLAMVQVLDGTVEAPTYLTAAARGASRGAAVAEAAIDAMTGGNNVLAAALPSAVAEGKVRTAVVFSEADAPVRWGLADDEGRLAALYAVVPHLGSFTATAGPDTYRVLRLPGVGVSLVSEGPSAAAWVEGWFAALIHATQFALRTAQPSTSVVAPTRTPLDGAGESAHVLGELEEECRRILAAAQEQAADILDKARREAAHEDEERREERARLEALRAELAAAAREDREPHAERHEPRDHSHDYRDRRADRERSELERLAAERERLSMLTDAERERASLVADARREAEAVRRDAERDRLTMLADARREADTLLREAERARASMLDAARRELDELRRDATVAHERHTTSSAAPLPPREAQFAQDLVVNEARRAAEEVLHEARRTAAGIVREATEQRERLVREAQQLHDPARESRADSDVATPPDTGATRAAELALLTATAQSVTAMASLLGKVAASQPNETATEPLSDVPRLFFGA